MRARLKLAFGVAFAVAAVMAASESGFPELKPKDIKHPCYSETEVQLLMRANHWTEEEAKTILDLACQFSSRHSL